MKLWLKTAMVALMTLAILVPLLMVGGVIDDRQRHRDEAVADIAANIGGAQVLAGPVLVVPYTELVTRQVQDAAGGSRTLGERHARQWTFFPTLLDADGQLLPEVRRRGLHAVRTYEWKGTLAADFDVRIPDDAPAGSERLIGQPFLSWGIGDVRGLRGTPQVLVGGKPVRPLQGSGVTMLAGNARDHGNDPRAGAAATLTQGSGLHVQLAPVQAGQVLRFDSRLSLALAGTERFGVLPVGASNDLKLASRWPHPSFSGLLPRHDIGAEGFRARWQVDALATRAQQLWSRGEWLAEGGDIAQVSLLDPVNPYLLAGRATKYGVLFVALTFAGFFMFELLRQVAVHPIQYALVGLALAIFFLLLVSLSEHIAFGTAYLLAASACIGLIGYYLSAVLGGPARGMAFAAMLATLYAALYGLLLLEDNALAVGAGLLFVILAAIMVATRRVDWYALAGSSALRPRRAD